MTIPAPIDAARAVLEHARESDAAYRQRLPWRLQHEHDMRGARYRVRAALVQPVPSDLAVLVREVVRALRIALDDSAGRLAGRPTRFPIHDSLAEFAQRARKALAAMPDESQAAIEALQPYHAIGGFRNGPLWLLRQLDDGATLSFAAGAVQEGATFGVNTRRKVDLVGVPTVLSGPFDDGTIVAEAVTRIVGPDPKLDMHFRADLVTAFARQGPARGAEVMASLATLVDHVARVVDAPALRR